MREGEPGPEQIASGIRRMLETAVPGSGDVSVEHVERVFGGNARRAWSATAGWTSVDGRRVVEPLIVLVRLAGSQVDADPEGEFSALEALAGQGVRCPKVWALDREGMVFGAPAVLLERLAGSADAVAFLQAEQPVGRSRTLDLARAAAELHAVAPRPQQAAGLQHGPQAGYWRESFLACRMEPHPSLSWLFDWLEDHEPAPPATPSIVHGDFRPGNVLYEGGRITGLLDWEMVHLGDPTEDLAWAYRALWSPQRFVPLDEFVEVYEAAGGRPVEPGRLRWHRVLAEVKFSTISLRAARAVADGTSDNLRLLDRAVTVLPAVERSLRWIRDAGCEPARC